MREPFGSQCTIADFVDTGMSFPVPQSDQMPQQLYFLFGSDGQLQVTFKNKENRDRTRDLVVLKEGSRKHRML